MPKIHADDSKMDLSVERRVFRPESPIHPSREIIDRLSEKFLHDDVPVDEVVECWVNI